MTFRPFAKSPLLPWFLLGLIFKLALWFFVPLLDDEAYFIQWAYSPDYGYYDHSPMVGWVNILLGSLGDSYLIDRAFPFLTAVLTTWLLWKSLERRKPEAAAPVALAYWISLPSVMHFPMLNDTCLVFFCALSMFFFARYLEQPRLRDAALTGLFWGAAFLSKYLAVLLGPGYLLALLWKRRDKVLPFCATMVPTVLPLVAVNLLWNYNNCWNNILFNFVTRHSVPDGFQTHLYLLTLVAIFGPPMAWYLIGLVRRAPSHPSVVVARILFLCPLVLFLLMSPKKLVGAHWLLPFIIPAYYLLAELPAEKLRRVIRFSLWYTGAAVLVIVGALTFKEQIFTPERVHYTAYLYFVHPDEVCPLLDREIPAGTARFSNTYSLAALLHHHCKVPVCSAFRYGRHGRQSDKDCDMRQWDGKDMTVILMNPRIKDIKPYFQSGTVRSIPLRKGQIHVFEGRGFDYAKYREGVLKPVREQFYTPPAWLPKGQCYFEDRYFSETTQ